MESWRHVWRNGIAPVLSDDSLRALSSALQYNRMGLIQRMTVLPDNDIIHRDSPVTHACVIGYCGWQGEGLCSVNEVAEYFARICHAADERLGEPAGIRWFLEWYDETNWNTVRDCLLAEVTHALEQRLHRYYDVYPHQDN